MSEQPKIKLKLTTTDKAFEVLGWLFILSIWVLTLTNYTNLPDTIPTHFNGAGQADGFGHKAMILILPVIATILYVGLTALNKFPHAFNYPTTITNDNALKQYTYATQLVRYLKLMVVLVFGGIALQTIRYVNGHTNGLGVWFLPLALALIFIPILFFVIKSYQTK